jgi:arginase
MTAGTTIGTGLHVVNVRYSGAKRATPEEDPIDDYAVTGAYDHFGAAARVVEPAFPVDRTSDDPVLNLGLMGAEIADAVAEGRAAGKPVLVVGSNCGIVPGVVGGLQQAHGPAARIGLVWFDAHGDFNTPRTTMSGMLGGMPVAVSAGLAHPRWREMSKQDTPLPTDRIVMVDVRNLDPAEEQLVRATDVVIAAPAEGFPGEDLQTAIADLAARCDQIYLHIDSDILDERYVPNHGTKEPNGPDMQQVQAAIDTVMSTGKVTTYAVVSVWKNREGGDIALASGTELVTGGLEAWRRYGMPQPNGGPAT